MNRIPHGQIVSPDCQSEPPEWKNRSECQRRKVITITESLIGMTPIPLTVILNAGGKSKNFTEAITGMKNLPIRRPMIDRVGTPMQKYNRA